MQTRLTCPWCGYAIANTPKPSATVNLSVTSELIFCEPSTRKYSTSPFTPASWSFALILRKIVVPTGVDYKEKRKKIEKHLG